MKIIAIIAVLICCILMFFVRRPYKAGILILGTMVFTLVRVPSVPFHSANSLIPICFLLSEIPHLKSLFKEAKGTVVIRLCGLAILISLISLLTSPHLSGVNIRYYVQSELFFKYFALLYAFWCFKDENTIRPIQKMTFIGIIVLTAFGILNYVSKSADYVSLMMSGIETTGLGVEGDEAGEKFMFADRFRVQSMFANPFDYGYMCILCLLLHIYCYTKKFENRYTFIIVLACSVFGIVTCGCRTIIFCTLVGVSVYFLLAFKTRKSIRYLFVAMLLVTITYQTILPVQEQIDKMMTMFDKNSDVSGSSLEARVIQYATVLWYIEDHPFFGRGYGFFNIDLGWGEGREYIVDQRLAGLEGVAMSKLLEQGFVGLFLYLLFWITLIIYMFKNRFVSEPLTALGVSVLAVYLSFANMTGELLSVYPTLLLLGFCVKSIEWKKMTITPPHRGMGTKT